MRAEERVNLDIRYEDEIARLTAELTTAQSTLANMEAAGDMWDRESDRLNAAVRHRDVIIARLQNERDDQTETIRILRHIHSTIIELHQPHEADGSQWCNACTTCWPCATFTTANKVGGAA